MKKIKTILMSILLVISISFVGYEIYVSQYYKPVQVEENYKIEDKTLVYEPKGETKAGLIFYQGAKVDEPAYSPLMEELANQGILCVVCQMPDNLAILGQNAATKVLEKYDIENWYLCGHSLGGYVASNYIAKHPADFDGIILLASYSRKDITATNVLSIYGDHDGVLNFKTYNKNKVNLPSDFTEVIIEGGNHAQFGSYGKQKKDGEPTISRDEQIKQTVEAIVQFMNLN